MTVGPPQVFENLQPSQAKGKANFHIFSVTATEPGPLGITFGDFDALGRKWAKRIVPASWAQSVGLETGDELITLNDHLICHLSKEDLNSFMSARPLAIEIARFLPERAEGKLEKHSLVPPPLLRNKGAQNTFTIEVNEEGPLGLVLSSSPPGRVFVRNVKPGTWAETAGIRVDDEILMANRKNVEETRGEDFNDLIINERPISFLIGRVGLVPKASAAPFALLEPEGGFVNPPRNRDAQAKFTISVPDGTPSLGFALTKKPPGRPFVMKVSGNSFAESVDVRVDDELLEVEGIDMLQLSTVAFDSYLRAVRPLRLTFGRLGLVPDRTGVEIDKTFDLPASILAGPPVTQSEIQAMIDKTGLAKRASDRACTELDFAVQKIPLDNLQERFEKLRLQWGKYHLELWQPFGANTKPSADALLARKRADDDMDEILMDLHETLEYCEAATQEYAASNPDGPEAPANQPGKFHRRPTALNEHQNVWSAPQETNPRGQTCAAEILVPQLRSFVEHSEKLPQTIQGLVTNSPIILA